MVDGWQRSSAERASQLREAARRDEWLDGWRRLLQATRDDVLAADRVALLLMFERCAAAWLPDLLRARTVDPAEPVKVDAWWELPKESPTRVPIVDARRHPREWHRNALLEQLHIVFSPFGDPSDSSSVPDGLSQAHAAGTYAGCRSLQRGEGAGAASE